MSDEIPAGRITADLLTADAITAGIITADAVRSGDVPPLRVLPPWEAVELREAESECERSAMRSRRRRVDAARHRRRARLVTAAIVTAGLGAPGVAALAHFLPH